ncbi:hypothetical protein QV08_09645 [Gallibacterium salpingitidis]|uniref:hypothetical protein n=1 Tax=Gallibacterium salpingitidis TaxID=505341 RepID=UPI000805D353|nr:hypothetical protein [Gallibacterium salpingitidis]OBX06661.1 hypothetical protein QV08_09645 [Gallibacterium salpingitidis]
MANIDHICTNCKKNNLRVRTSEKVGMLVVNAIIYCNNCGTKLEVKSQITRVWTPTYNERPEALRANKPLLQLDTKTVDMFEDEQQP